MEQIRRQLAAFFVIVTVILGGCSRSTATDSKLGERLKAQEEEIAQLKAELQVKEDTLKEMKRSLAMTPPPPNESRVTAGRGDGRFVVVPNRVRPGNPIAVFCDIADVDIRIVRLQEGRETIVAELKGPSASHFLLYTIPNDLPDGSYRINFWGHGGTQGEATIQVAKDE